MRKSKAGTSTNKTVDLDPANLKIDIKKKTKTSVKNIFNSLRSGRINLSEMDVGIHYKITKIERTPTKYGERLLLTFDNKIQLYLPERYNAMEEAEMLQINDGGYKLINHGPVGKSFHLELVDGDESGENV